MGCLVARALFVALCMVASACDEPVAGEGRALQTALAQAERAALDTRITPADLTDPVRRSVVFRRSFARHGRRLGEQKFTLDAEYELRPETGPALRLTEHRVALSGANGDFSLDERMAWVTTGDTGEGGRRCARVGGQLYFARRHGPATHFQPRGAEDDLCLDAALEPWQSWLNVFEVVLEAEATAGAPAGARETIAVTLGARLDPDGVPRALPSFWQPNEEGTATVETMGVPGPRSWLSQSHAALRSLKGSARLDVETGLPLSGELEARLSVVKGAARGELVLSVRLTAEPRNEPILVPEKVVDGGSRPRPFLDQERLLGPASASAPDDTRALPKPGDAPPLVVGAGAEGEPVKGTPSAAPPGPEN